MSIACGGWRSVRTQGLRSSRRKWQWRASASPLWTRLLSIALMPDDASVRRNVASFALLALVAQIPFELRHTVFGLSNLQWTFIADVLLSVPDLLANWRKLLRDRLVQAASLFVAIEWIAALGAPE